MPPETLFSTVLERLRSELEEISLRGEDLDRLAHWLLSMLDTSENRDLHLKARDSWGEGFNYWGKNGLPSATQLEYPSSIDCISFYTNEVSLPFSEFRERSEKSEKEWMDSKGSRSPGITFCLKFSTRKQTAVQ